jgi:hypothetical protein
MELTRAHERLRTAAVLALVCVGLTACSRERERREAEQRQAVEAQLVKAEAQADAMNAAWHTALAAAEARKSPPADAPRCDVPGVMPLAPGELKKRLGVTGANGPDLDAFMRNAAAARADSGESSELVITPTALAAARSPRARMLATRAKDIRRDLERAEGARIEALLKQANELAARGFWEPDVVVIVEAEAGSRGVDVGKKTFAGRAALGRSYVFSYGTNEIVCAGRFVATSSDTVEFVSHLGLGSGDAYGAIDRDLRARVLDQGKRSLQKTAAAP